jgi:hypothetical protein
MPITEEIAMTDTRKREDGGTNDRPLDETIAGTGPGIPDDALAPGEELPEPPSDEEVERVRRLLEGQENTGEAKKK